MNKDLKAVRDWLKHATRADFYRVIKAAKVTDLERHILRGRFIRGKSNLDLAMDNYISASYVDKLVRRAYERIKAIL